MTKEFIIVFDLDDTLYLERDFVLSGFEAVGAWFEQEYGIPGLGERCQALFCAGKRKKIFNHALNSLSFAADAVLVEKLVTLYRSHPPRISLAPDAVRYFQCNRCRPRAMITDGRRLTQRAKIEALGLTPHFEIVICTDAWGVGFQKPHTRAYETVEKWANGSTDLLVYVADNPIKDFVTPKRRGWTTVQIARSERVHTLPAPDGAHKAHATIETLDELDACLSSLAENYGEQPQSGD